MSPSANQSSAFSAVPAEKPIEDVEVNAMMGFNRVDLGKDGLAGSMYATPGVTFGTKKEILEEIAKKAVEKMDGAAKPKVNGVETKATQADDGMEMDSSASHGTA